MTTPPNQPFDFTTAFQQLIQNQANFQQNQENLQNNLATLTNELHHLRTRLAPPGFNNTEITPFPQTSIKLDIPRFDGTYPMGWIFKINQFFDFHHTPEDQRLRIASFYMDGEALTWFQWMHSNGQLLSWPGLLHALESRFAPSLYDDPKGALFKLCQTSSVKEYQTQFESLANRITGLPPQFYLSCFISGLKPPIRREVQAFQPGSLTQAISLAKLQEEKTLDTRPHPSFPKPNPSHTPSSSSFRPTLTVAPSKPTPTKRLSPAELQARREKGLCYNCDEKFIQGHRCKCLFHLLIVEPDPVVLEHQDPTLNMVEGVSDPNTEPVSDPTLDPPQISLHALMGHSIPQTLRVLGHIQHQPISVLIDSGSTHNFVQDRIIKQLGLVTEPAHSFQVLVGNGDQLQCSALCPQVPLLLGQHKFLVDLFCLPISGA
ncbi:retrotransposon-derived protein PEG10-like [Trifolium medium]|uniref:Retrotransposon-derived protein PEG10-like n=1 Tax=Trifolium medium TaxID=97028 RepID=A0A392MNY8_9FABA|nr:retrotransposon-derived protein PEG10-like [Trifolium medium]